jgi:hypothetical protein
MLNTNENVDVLTKESLNSQPVYLLQYFIRVYLGISMPKILISFI